MTEESRLVEYLRKVTTDLQKTRSRLREAEARSAEPIAVVGIGCRYPGGVRSAADLWRLVVEGRDAITGFPTDRGWDVAGLYDPDPEAVGKSCTREGGFLTGVDLFDPEFFGLSPREALTMDPQQRLLLETTWEAMEDAGIVPGTLRGSRTGVFTGVMHHDYGGRFPKAPKGFEGYIHMGSAGSMAVGRVSYLFGLEGPAVTVDTACSSSLVALHLACQALRNGECDLALAGGVAVMATPTFFIEYSRQRVLSPDGRCRSFSEDGKGTGWSEGVGVVLVERLSDARRLGHPVLALVRGSAVNQDGASNGLTAPSGPAQQRVIQAALRRAGLTPAHIDLLEAHGTGTRLGDPIEAQALQATYGKAHTPTHPLYLGSLKSNIGHTQAAAGIAGIIKTIQAIRHHTLPPTLHAHNPTTQIDWTPATLQLLTHPQPWNPTNHPHRAGISSFGMSGTNAHIIIEEADPHPTDKPPPPDTQPPWAQTAVPLVLSAKTPEALQDQATALHHHLTHHPQLPLHQIAHTLTCHRTHFPHRTTLTGNRTHILNNLTDPAAITATAAHAARSAHIVLVYSGQGAQRPGMGRQLAQHFPVFAEALDEACAHLDPHLPHPLRNTMWDPDPTLLHQTHYAQPALFAHQYALTRLLSASGLAPAALVGHSVGEITAATTAGILTLPDAARLITTRAHLMQHLPPGGTMLAITAGEEEVAATLTPGVALAAVNGPRAVVVSGPCEEIGALDAHWRREGRRTTRLRVSHAFHSPLMDPVLDELAAVLGQLAFREPGVPLVPCADSRHPVTAAAYWRDQARGTVRFHRALTQLPESRLLLEIGPDAALTPLVATGHTVIPAAHRDQEETRAFLHALGRVHAHGADVDWSTLFPPAGAPVGLPPYAFQRRRYWLPPTAPEGAGGDPVDHPFLSRAMELPAGGGLVLSGRVSPSTDPWLADHAVAGTVLLAGTAFLELAWTAARHAECGQVAELVVRAPLALPASGCEVQVWVAAPGDGDRGLVIRARGGDGAEGSDWVVHASGTLAAAPGGAGAEVGEAGWARGPWPPVEAEQVPVEELYGMLAARGYTYGPAFRGLRAVWRAGAETYAEVALPEDCRDMRHGVHPALLDAALHPLVIADGGAGEVRLPFSFGGATVHASGARVLRVRLRTGSGAVRLDAATSSGEAVVTTESLVLRAVDTGLLPDRSQAHVDRLRHEVTWQQVPGAPSAERAPGTWLVLSAEPGGPSWGAAPVEHAVTVTLDADRDRAELTALLPAGRFDGVLCFAHRPETLLAALRALDDAKVTARVWCVTHRADEDPDAAAVWGAGRAAALELPGRWGGLIDVPGTRTGPVAAQLAGLLSGSLGEDQVRIRPDGVFVRRLVAAGRAGDPDAWQPSGTVLVTGGTGALGAHIARWVAGLGGCSLVLVSRRGPAAPGAQELLAELAGTGTPARAVAADVTDHESMAALVREAAEGGAPVRAVFHTAGLGAQTPLLETGPEEVRAVMAAKADGARVLDEVLTDAELDAFVLFSSVSGTWGAAGQAAYGAANAALDALAVRRRARGLAAASLAWGPWAGGGMVDAGRERWLRRQGLVPLPVTDAVAALARSLALGGDWVLVDAAWSRFLPVFTAARPAPLFERLAGDARDTAEGGTGDAAGAGRFPGLPAAERSVRELVRAEVASAIGQPDPARIDLDRPLRELGFDSLMSVRLRDRLAGATGIRLPATLAFDHPTSTALAAHLEDLLAAAPGRTRRPAAGPVTAVEEPLAIVGMACRYPGGVATPEELWRLVAEGRDAITAFPSDRGWDLAGLYDPDPERTGRAYAREGGFLDDPAGFDADFFGIPPREALAMDPQQRLLLEAAWEAVESAGIVPESLRATRTGVFAGVMYNDYYSRLDGIPDGLEGILGLANSNSVMSGRVSYLLGLEGPAVTVDTACSSSLVALHLACQALRDGECDAALAGGATVMATPNIFVEFSRQGGLARDGRCKPFSAEADGTGWSEGAGVLLVERLSDARRLGHQVLALVRGSAVNQDGASNGLTAPNGPAQQRVIEAALRRAGVAPADIDAVEAHGTGTRLGDPIEAQALQAVYGHRRPPESPLRLGSLKSNIGHTQAAAGVAGIIKTVQALRHETLPPTLHTDLPTPEVDWSAGSLALLTHATPWPRTGRPRLAGVSSFGISGTNAHVVLEEGDALPPPEPAREAVAPVPFVLSSRTPRALPEQARALRAHLVARPELAPRDVAWSLATARSAAAHRAVVVADGREELLGALTALADGPGAVAPDTVRTGAARAGRVALMFPGQGSQWPGMGRELLGASEVFAASVEECEEALAPFVDWSLREVLRDADAALRAPVDVVQPALFAVMVSLARVWQDWGVPVDAVVGHSQGEIAAACVSGALSLPDGARVVATRSRLLARLAGTGGMVYVGLPAAEVRARLAGRLSIASVNGPGSVVVSGPDEALDELACAARAEGVHVRRVEVDYASHSAAVEAVREPLLAELAGLAPREGSVPLYSTVTGTRLSGGELDAEYWYRNLRETVRLETSVGALAADGFAFFAECSPHPVLGAGVRETLEALGAEGAVFGSLRRDDGGRNRMLRSLAEGYAEGLPVDWHRVLGGGRQVPLPTYAFQHERFWIDTPAGAGASGTGGASGADARFWEAVERGDLEELTDEIGAAEGLGEVLPALAAWRRRGRRQAELDSLRYDVIWRPHPSGTDAAPGGRWLLLTSAAPESDRVRALLAEQGAEWVPVALEAADAERAVVAARIQEAAGDRRDELAGVLSLLALDERPHPSLPGLTAGIALSVAAVQALGDLALEAPLWAVTCGATDASGPPRHPGQHQMWGLGRVVGLEHSARWGGLVDLPEEPDGPAARALLGILADGGHGEDQWAVRDAATHVRRLVRGSPAASAGGRWQPHGTVLITGASGSLGPHLARSMAERGAPHLALVSRRGAASPGMPGLLAELREQGCPAEAYACDVRDREGLRTVLRDLAEAGRPVVTAVHAAAHLDLASVESASLGHFAEVVDAKVTGAVNLAELLDPEHLRELVLFSSIAGVWGSADHGAYAAANACLDAYAQRCRAGGLPVSSVAWGIWDEQITKDRTDADLVIRRGLPFLDRATAFEGLYQALATERACHVVAEVDWSRFVPVFTSVRPSPLLADLAEDAAGAPGEPRVPGPPDAARGPALRARLAAMAPGDQERTVLDLVRQTGAVVLGHGSGDRLPAEADFRQAGFDSLLSVDFRNRINRATGLSLPSTLLFDHTSPARLAAHLLDQLTERHVASADGVLTRLDGIEAEMRALGTDDDPVRQRLTSRLETLLRTLRGHSADGAGGVGGAGRQEPAPALESAGSTEELLDLLDSRYGES